MRRLVLLAAVLLASCRRPSSGGPKEGVTPPPPAGSGLVEVAAGAGRRADGEKKGESIAIPAGSVWAGSVPGDEGRDPTTEPAAMAYDLPAFSIDALPYPNEPGVPPKTGVSQAEAARSCEERGARLCTELEWERACRGPGGEPFSTGTAWDPTCAKTPEQCVSGFGVRSMGAALQEWTASAITDAHHGGAKRAAVRGASASASAAGHRCAARAPIDPSVTGRPFGFRCCTGPAATVAMAAIEGAPAFRKADVDASRLGEVFATIPELARVRAGLRFFKESEARDVTEKAKSPPGAGLVLTTEPILWSPEPGAELLVATGKSKGGAWVVALHRLAGDKYRLASSMLFVNEQGPVVLAYQPNIRREIVWSMAWGAAGEGGAVTARDDHRIVIVQR